ncbi:MAG: hypothetical protein AAF329_11975 [Cyanobacteria bacterium P01_A01_bin.17]
MILNYHEYWRALPTLRALQAADAIQVSANPNRLGTQIAQAVYATH